MSGPDQGDEDKSFLARWSQRKQEAKRPDREAPVADANTSPGPAAEGDAAPQFDLSSLPKLEDVTETTDITAFLRKGVPEHLRNAALRKSWALDPAIRNYVNPALEYAYLGIRQAACRAVARSELAWMSPGWFRRSWAAANRWPNRRYRPLRPERSQRAIPCNPVSKMQCKNQSRICRPRL
jgi:hypothetical protein